MARPRSCQMKQPIQTSASDQPARTMSIQLTVRPSLMELRCDQPEQIDQPRDEHADRDLDEELRLRA